MLATMTSVEPARVHADGEGQRFATRQPADRAAEKCASEFPDACDGFVTLPCGEREVSAPQELLGRCDCGPPRGHRRSAKRAVRLGGDEMALDVEGVVDGGVG